jgi:hypothetical protein
MFFILAKTLYNVLITTWILQPFRVWRWRKNHGRTHGKAAKCMSWLKRYIRFWLKLRTFPERYWHNINILWTESWLHNSIGRYYDQKVRMGAHSHKDVASTPFLFSTPFLLSLEFPTHPHGLLFSCSCHNLLKLQPHYTLHELPANEIV